MLKRALAATALAAACIFAGSSCAKKTFDTSTRDYGREAATIHAVDYLFRAQHNNNWESDLEASRGGPQVGGETALALYALQQARRVSNDPRLAPQSPELAPAFAWLRKTKTDNVYPTSLKIMALAASGDDANRQMALDLGQSLLAAVKPGGGYSYKLTDGSLQFDMSNSDYGQAGVLVAGQLGMTVPDTYRATMARFWKTQQNPDGGWGYAPPGVRPNSSPGLTGGAVASMLALGLPATDPGVRNGLAYLDKNFSAPPADFYAFFNVARAASASHTKTLGNADWHQLMQYQLIKAQSPDGSWYVDQDTFWGHPNQTICTAYALLFLAE